MTIPRSRIKTLCFCFCFISYVGGLLVTIVLMLRSLVFKYGVIDIQRARGGACEPGMKYNVDGAKAPAEWIPDQGPGMADPDAVSGERLEDK
jgi:hypothetical protein